MLRLRMYVLYCIHSNMIFFNLANNNVILCSFAAYSEQYIPSSSACIYKEYRVLICKFWNQHWTDFIQ